MIELEIQLNLTQPPRYFERLIERLPVRPEILRMKAMMAMIETLELAEAA